MKKLLLLFCMTMMYYASHAQTPSYNTSAGLTIEVGDGGTVVGPAIKHFFDVHNAIQGEIMFGSGTTFVSAFYQFNQPIQNAGGLDYYLGAGPAVSFGGGSTDFYLRPTAGLDYKVDKTPLDLSFDWRPTFYLGSNSTFTAARFGIGVRFAF